MFNRKFLTFYSGVLYALLVFPASGNVSQTLNFKHFELSESDSVGDVIAIAQDHYGFMWFGGRKGVARFDSSNYVVYRHNPDEPGSLPSNVVNDILVDQNQQVWLATDNGLSRYDYASNQFSTYKASPDNPNTLSSNQVFSLYQDHLGQLWMTTKEGLNRYIPETDSIKRYPDNEGERDLYVQYTMDVADDSNGNYYLASGFGLIVWNRNDQTVTRYNTDNNPGGVIANNLMRTVRVDRKGRVWVGSDGGLLEFIPKEKRFIFYANTLDAPDAKWSSAVWDVNEDREGRIWVAYEGQGLGILENGHSRVTMHVNNEQVESSLRSNIIRRVFVDKDGDVWLGMYPGGIDHFSRYANAFKRYRAVQGALSDDKVRELKVIDGELWVGTDNGISILNLESNTFRYMHRESHKLAANEVLSILKTEDQLWLGSWSAGVATLSENEPLYFSIDPGRDTALSSNSAWKILQTRDGNIWIATIGGGLNLFDPETSAFEHFYAENNLQTSIADQNVWDIEEAPDGTLWIGTQNGLTHFNTKQSTFFGYVNTPDNPNSLMGNHVTDLHFDSQERLWVATLGGGLHQHTGDQNRPFIRYNMQQGLASNNIASVISDDQGNIWMGTDRGLSMLEPSSGKVKNFGQSSGVQAGEFHIGAAAKLPNGEIVFGGLQGITRFDPKALSSNSQIPNTLFTKLEVNNKAVSAGEENSPLSHSFLTSDSFTLNHLQNIFTVHYAGLNYRDSENARYEYFLEGFESDWFDVGQRRFSTYTNLSAGNYRFHVRSINNDGVAGPINTIDIIITPPPWKTWWAYTLYVLIVLTIVGWYLYTQRKILNQERRVVDELKKLDKLKDDFLANTSHELRTPLFGMIGLAESLLDDIENKDHSEVNSLSMIVASGKRLSAIVEDILDFSQIRNNALKVRLQPLQLNALSSMVVALTQPLVSLIKVKINNRVPVDLPLIHADENRMQQILHNLIGNAVKFTQDGEINVSAEQKGDFIQVLVEDTGIGIEKDQFEQLFKSFTQVEDSFTRSQGGSGLGLAITKSLVQKMGGKIWLESEINKGSRFYFTVPIYHGDEDVERINIFGRLIDKAQYAGVSTYNLDDQEENEKEPVDHNSADQTSDDKPTADEHDEAEAPTEISLSEDLQFIPRIMIVDDEPVNRRVLRNHLLKEKCEVIDAVNGDEAFDIVRKQEKIDLILMDVMMPLMSGYEACTKIRKMYGRSKLPIIFITAKFQLMDIVAGFDAGGNDFLSKPVSRQELLARVNLHLQLLASQRGLEKIVEKRTVELKMAYEKLEELSLSDPLTGLGNRRYFEKYIDKTVADTHRKFNTWLLKPSGPSPKDGDIVFSIVDIDHFKSVNDTYGHDAGDIVIKRVAEILREACRTSDFVVRWGGEEFLIVARSMDRSAMPIVSERIRTMVEAQEFDIGLEKPIQVTCSQGYASFPIIKSKPNHFSWEDSIKLADICLYAAKQSNRNCWVGIEESKEDITDLQSIVAAVETKTESNAVNVKSAPVESKNIVWTK